MAFSNNQLKFIREVAQGKSLIDAYNIAYPRSKKWKNSSIRVNASKLYNQPEIRKEITRLKKEIEQDIINQVTWSAIESEKVYKKIIYLGLKDIENNGFRQANSSAVINANKELTEMIYRNRSLEDNDSLLEARISKEIAQRDKVLVDKDKVLADTDKVIAETERIKGIADEIEDISPIIKEIYGVDDE